MVESNNWPRANYCETFVLGPFLQNRNRPNKNCPLSFLRDRLKNSGGFRRSFLLRPNEESVFFMLFNSSGILQLTLE